MSQALERIEVPTVLPPGVTRKQWRLAALLPQCETAAEALRLAGYSATTVRNNGYRQVALGGVKRATEALAARQADRAKGLIGKGHELINGADSKELADRDKFMLGLAFVKQGHEIGENIETTGAASEWKLRLQRCAMLAFRFGAAAQRSRPQDVVVAPLHNPKSRKK